MFSYSKFVLNLIRCYSSKIYTTGRIINNSSWSYLPRSNKFRGIKFYRKFAAPILTLTGVSLGQVLSVVNLKMSETDLQKILDEADKLFDESKFEDLLKFLQNHPESTTNPKILWRTARCMFQIAKKSKNEKSKYQQLVQQAYDLVKKSLELDDKDGAAHKWASILLDAISELKGIKERVLQILNVRNHMELAIKYAPDDPTSYFLLGQWHYECNQVSWWERKLCSAAFGSLPDADMEVALQMFEKAEAIESDFYSKNKLMLAKTLLQLKRDRERSITLLDEVVSKYSTSEKWDDKEAYEEAKKLLSQNK